MKTSLTKSLGHKETNWKAVFTCGKNGALSDEEITSYVELMKEWETCPCGNLSIHVPRFTEDDEADGNNTNQPIDNVLNNLGVEIYQTIENDRDFENALNILELLQNREKYVLAQVKRELETKIAATNKQLTADKKALKAVSE